MTKFTQAISFVISRTSSLQWQARAYELYELQGSSNFTTWTRVINANLPTNSTGFSTSLPRQFYRILKVP